MKYYTIRVKMNDGKFWKLADIKGRFNAINQMNYYTKKYGKEKIIMMEK